MPPKCPICGDPAPFVLWQADEPPIECPYNASAKSVTDCDYQMDKAWQSAEFRRLVPDAFDGFGMLLPGRSHDVLRAFVQAHPNKALRLG